MPDLKSLDNIYLVLAFIVPGMIVSVVRAQFITGRTLKQSENIIFFLALSGLYYALTLPLIEMLLKSGLDGWRRGFAWIAVVILGPAILGVILGFLTQRNVGRWIAHSLRLNPVHSAPTAWDYVFPALPMGGRYVRVTMEDGIVTGLFGDQSFASSDPSERDIFLEEVWDLSEIGEWTPRPEKIGVLIPAKQVKFVEFWNT